MLHNDQNQRSYFAEEALLPTGWAKRVRIVVNDLGVITSVTSQVKSHPQDLLIKGTLIPGIPNLHSHSFQRVIAGQTYTRLVGGKNHFWTWREAMYRTALCLSPDDIEAIAAQCFLEQMSCGYTSVAEFHYLHKTIQGLAYDDLAELSHAVIRAALKVGLPITHLPVLYRWSGVGQQSPLPEQRRFILNIDEYMQLITDLECTYIHDPQVQIGIAPHSLRAVSAEDLDCLTSQQFSASTNGKPKPFHIHIAEQIDEVNMWLELTKQRPIEWLLDHYAGDEHWCLLHATHAQSSEVSKMTKAGVTVGLCPSTEADLGDGIFPLSEFLDKGGRYGIGSDSNVLCNPAEELKILEWGQRLIHQQRNMSFSSTVPSQINPSNESLGQSLILAAVQGGSSALHRSTGIESGSWADWFTIDDQEPGLYGAYEHQWGDRWIFANRRQKVRSVFIAGEHIISEGRHPLQDEINRDFKIVMERLWKS